MHFKNARSPYGNVKNGGAGGVAPSILVAPAISMPALFVGQLVSGNDGTWAGSPSPTLTYQWQRSTDGGVTWTDIAGANSANYTSLAADSGHRIRKNVIANNGIGGPVVASSNVLAINLTLLDRYTIAAFVHHLKLQRGGYYGNNLVEILRIFDSATQNISHDINGEIDIAAAIAFSGNNNRLIFSNTFTNANWNKSNSSIISTNNLAPDSTNTARLLELSAQYGSLEQSAGVTSSVIPAMALFSSEIFCISICVKKVNRNLLRLNNGTSTTLFNLDSPSGNIVSLGNGWFKIWLTGTGAEISRLRIQGHDGSASGDQFLIWGAQINKGSTPSTYVETTTNPSGFARIRTYYDHSSNARHAVQSTVSRQDFIVVDGASILENGEIVAERYDSPTMSGSGFYAITSFSPGNSTTAYSKNMRKSGNYDSMGSNYHYEHSSNGIGFRDPAPYNNSLATNTLYGVKIWNRAVPNGQALRRNVVAGTFDSGTALTTLVATLSIAGTKGDFAGTWGRVEIRGEIFFTASHDLATMQEISLLI
jgi:hypothetical protein